MYYKRNNSKGNELQPYDPNNGEYKEKNANLLEEDLSVRNYYARKLGGNRFEFPLKFPKNDYPIEYLHDYFNNEIDWNDIIIPKGKMLFLIDVKHPKKRFLIFRNLLGYDESNINQLEKQILNNASKFKVYVNRKSDLYGFRVKIFMPIKFANSNEHLIIKTCWVIKENCKPSFVTAWYQKDFKEEMKDEI